MKAQNNQVEAEVVYQITAPYFVAGVVLDYKTKTVKEAAPILHYMVGWPLQAVLDYCTRKHWNWRIVGLGRPWTQPDNNLSSL